ncbi:unnamed protein product [Lathyrus oleraceus]
MTTSIKNMFAILCIILVILNSGVTSEEVIINSKICRLPGSCPKKDETSNPYCYRFCIEGGYPKGGSCEGDLCCCERF